MDNDEGSDILCCSLTVLEIAMDVLGWTGASLSVVTSKPRL